jgi:hypothetical protein
MPGRAPRADRRPGRRMIGGGPSSDDNPSAEPRRDRIRVRWAVGTDGRCGSGHRPRPRAKVDGCTMGGDARNSIFRRRGFRIFRTPSPRARGASAAYTCGTGCLAAAEGAGHPPAAPDGSCRVGNGLRKPRNVAEELRRSGPLPRGGRHSRYPPRQPLNRACREIRMAPSFTSRNPYGRRKHGTPVVIAPFPRRLPARRPPVLLGANTCPQTPTRQEAAWP